jgi:hypothetical protein
MVAPTCFGITLPSSGSVPSAFWEMLNWGAVDRILWMGVLCLVMWWKLWAKEYLLELRNFHEVQRPVGKTAPTPPRRRRNSRGRSPQTLAGTSRHRGVAERTGRPSENGGAPDEWWPSNYTPHTAGHPLGGWPRWGGCLEFIIEHIQLYLCHLWSIRGSILSL